MATADNIAMQNKQAALPRVSHHSANKASDSPTGITVFLFKSKLTNPRQKLNNDTDIIDIAIKISPLANYIYSAPGALHDERAMKLQVLQMPKLFERRHKCIPILHIKLFSSSINIHNIGT